MTSSSSTKTTKTGTSSTVTTRQCWKRTKTVCFAMYCREVVGALHHTLWEGFFKAANLGSRALQHGWHVMTLPFPPANLWSVVQQDPRRLFRVVMPVCPLIPSLAVLKQQLQAPQLQQPPWLPLQQPQRLQLLQHLSCDREVVAVSVRWSIHRIRQPNQPTNLFGDVGGLLHVYKLGLATTDGFHFDSTPLSVFLFWKPGLPGLIAKA